MPTGTGKLVASNGVALVRDGGDGHVMHQHLTTIDRQRIREHAVHEIEAHEVARALLRADRVHAPAGVSDRSEIRDHGLKLIASGHDVPVGVHVVPEQRGTETVAHLLSTDHLRLLQLLLLHEPEDGVVHLTRILTNDGTAELIHSLTSLLVVAVASVVSIQSGKQPYV